MEENDVIKNNYDVFSRFLSTLSKLNFDGIPRVVIMTRSRMFKHKWIYPWGKYD